MPPLLPLHPPPPPRHTQEPAAWDGIARCYCDPSNSSSSEEQQAQALARYEAGHAAREAAGRGSDPELWQLHAGFLQQRLESLLQRQQQQEGGGEGAAEAAGEDAVRAAAKGAQQLLKLFARAKAAGAADEQLFGSWVAAAQRLGQPKMALKAARAGCEALPASGRLWQVRLQCFACSAASVAWGGRMRRLCAGRVLQA